MFNKLFDIDQPVTKVNTWALGDTFYHIIVLKLFFRLRIAVQLMMI